MYIYIYIYNRASRFGSKLEVNTLRDGGSWVFFWWTERGCRFGRQLEPPGRCSGAFEAYAKAVLELFSGCLFDLASSMCATLIF